MRREIMNRKKAITMITSTAGTRGKSVYRQKDMLPRVRRAKQVAGMTLFIVLFPLRALYGVTVYFLCRVILMVNRLTCP
jgi:hypothetical protein